MNTNTTSNTNNCVPEFIRILLVEDEYSEAAIVKADIEDSGLKCSIEHVTTLCEAEAVLTDKKIDVVLLDMQLPDAYRDQSLKGVRKIAPEIPIVMMSNTNDDVVAAWMLNNGAQEYITKGTVGPHGLRRIILHALERTCMLQTEAQIHCRESESVRRAFSPERPAD